MYVNGAAYKPKDLVNIEEEEELIKPNSAPSTPTAILTARTRIQDGAPHSSISSGQTSTVKTNYSNSPKHSDTINKKPTTRQNQHQQTFETRTRQRSTK